MNKRRTGLEAERTSSGVSQEQGSALLGLAVCWLLNLVHLGVAYLVLVSGERTLPWVFALVGTVGLTQIGYVAPIWHLLRRRGKRRMATGLAIAAGITLLVNAILWRVYW
jgi:hypothetical protein